MLNYIYSYVPFTSLYCFLKIEESCTCYLILKYLKYVINGGNKIVIRTIIKLNNYIYLWCTQCSSLNYI